jgi:UDP-N-acetylglucosamine/UDP-N-acetylgalactosamine diphosphorylase
MSPIPEDLSQTLNTHGQQHLLKWWNDLTDQQQSKLLQQIKATDFSLIQSVWSASQQSNDAASSTSDRIQSARPPQQVVHQPENPSQQAVWDQARKIGEDLLTQGKVAVVTVAGGQGSRLGFDHPKGMFPIGPISERSLFQIFAEQIAAIIKTYGGSVPWLIMTSAATHDATVDYFHECRFLGLEESTVSFFQQGSLPAVDADTGQILMADKASMCLSPDGHGGLVPALRSSGLLDQLNQSGVEYLFYHQVDNPTVIMCDPALIGLHHQHESELTTKVAKKHSPSERMGVLVDVNGQLQVIEYSELTEEQAAQQDETGQWIFWAGNTAIHVFSRSFLERLTTEGCQLELHVAHKKVAHIDADGQLVEPETPNANKFERFIFDALPLAHNALVVEADRSREFNPVKNATGADSPDTARAALSRIGREWLQASGQSVDEAQAVEISPLAALDADQLAGRLADGTISVSDLVRPAS